MDKITVVCHKDHDKGCGCYIWKCLLCEVERLSKREWVGLTEEEFFDLLSFGGRLDNVETPLIADFIRTIQAKLKERNT